MTLVDEYTESKELAKLVTLESSDCDVSDMSSLLTWIQFGGKHIQVETVFFSANQYRSDER